LGAARGGISESFKRDFYEYDPEQNKWFEKKSFPGSPRVDAASFTIIDKGYAGLGFDGVYKKDFYKYDPSRDKWERILDFAGGAVSASIGISSRSKGFIVGGDSRSDNKRFVFEYIPDADKWQKKKDFPGYARYFLSGCDIDTNLFIAGAGGAEGGAMRFRDFFLYDILKDEWSNIPDYPVSKEGITRMCFGNVNGKIFMGTGNNGLFFNNWNMYEYYYSVRGDSGVYDETVCYPLKYNNTWELYQECIGGNCYAGVQIKTPENLNNFCYKSLVAKSYQEISIKSKIQKNPSRFILLPRSFAISTDKRPSKEVGMRLYFTREEIENLVARYVKISGKEFSLDKIKILQYNEKDFDLLPLNNKTDLSYYNIIPPQLFSYGFQQQTIVASFKMNTLQSELYLAMQLD
jgi:hypothetical protein